MPKRRAASRRLIPSIRTAKRTLPYSSTHFIPQPSAFTAKSFPRRSFTPAQPDNPAASLRDFVSGAYTRRGKIGRNDPCPCGPGKKYKRCCGQN